MKNAGEPEDNSGDAGDQPPPTLVLRNDSASPSQSEITKRYNQCIDENRQRFISRPLRRAIRCLHKYGSAVTAVATVVIAGFTWSLTTDSGEQARIADGQLKTLRDQQIIMQGQLDTMQTDKRAWIKLDVSVNKYVIFTEWDKAKFLNVPLTIKMRNYGETPARNIMVQLTMREHPGNPKRNDLDIPQKALCDLATKDATANPFAGISVFPNDSEPHETNIGSGVGYDKTNAPLISLFGCVDYTFSNDRHGQTAFRFLIGKVVGDSIMGLPFIEGAPVTNYNPDTRLVAGGYPAIPPNEARLPVGEFYVGADDGGNYAR